MMRSVWPNSTGWASWIQISLILPDLGARIGFIVFIASTMKSVSPSFTVSPTLTKGGFEGSGATKTVPTMGDVTAPAAGPSRFTGASAVGAIPAGAGAEVVAGICAAATE